MYVELGTRSALHERRVFIYFAQLYAPEAKADYHVDNIFFELTELGSVPLSLELTVAEAKQQLVPLLAERAGLTCTADALLMREKASDKLTRVYSDCSSLEAYNFF